MKWRHSFASIAKDFRYLLPWALCGWIAALPAQANPYLPKPSEAQVSTYIATCATSGGFMHLYTALDQKIFAKYGIAIKHVVIQGGSNLVLAAMGADEIQFLYCAGDSTIPAMAAGGDAKLIASPLVGLPYVIIAQKDIRTIQDLKGKSIGIGSLVGLPFRLIKAFIKKFNLENVQIRPLGGSQPERYNALVQSIIQAAPFTPPLDVRGKRDGFNVLYHLNDLGLPFLYSSLHTNSKSLAERRPLVQKMVAAIAESVRFVEDNPEKAKAAVSKILKVKDPDALQSSYDAYAIKLINRRLTVPVNAVSDAVEIVRESGIKITRKPTDLVDNGYTEDLEKSGFLKELWGEKLP